MSSQAYFLLPVLGMIFLTFGIILWMLKLRYRAVRQDGVNPNYFRLNRGAKIPDYLLKVTQHYNNLLELPILFYLAVILVLALKELDIVYIGLAWLFFLSRLVHSYIHVTSNRLLYRKNSFIVSGATLLFFWMKITVDVIQL